MSLYKRFVLPSLTFSIRRDDEIAHQRGLLVLKVIGVLPVWEKHVTPLLRRYDTPKTVLGMTFPNPVGLAAGFDKNAEVLPGLARLGFGSLEAGTVTHDPQKGNPHPRMFRLMRDESLINRMGFNNKGAHAMQLKLKSRPDLGIPVGINVGANKDTRDRTANTIQALLLVAPFADYITINVSSPNTPGLRDLQAKNELRAYLKAIMDALRLAGINKPVLVKIAPDVDIPQLEEILEVLEELVQGVILCNTTIDRPSFIHDKHLQEPGGLSGKHNFDKAFALIAHAIRHGFRLPIFGVSGINAPERAIKMLDAGVAIVQLYTGFIFEGPLLPYRINRAIYQRYAATQ